MNNRILVSACLLGRPVRYNGRAFTIENSILQRWQSGGLVVPLCPEVAAGFPTPRPPAEIEAGFDGEDVLANRAHIFEDNGADVTSGFITGATIAVETATKYQCRFALLTDGSPSCGSSFIYSGRHDGMKRQGMGAVTAALRRAGVRVFAQHQIKQLQYQLDASIT